MNRYTLHHSPTAAGLARFIPTRLLGLLATLLLMGGLTACSDNGGTNDTVDEGCTEGFLGCECIDGVACFPGSDWVCLDGVCAEPVCEAGAEGCVCYPNNSCDTDAEGEPMLCTNGVCTARSCTLGSMGCECADGGSCEAGLVCSVSDGVRRCAPEACIDGQEGCPCGEGRACDAGLICYKDACVDPGCVPGDEGCFCRSDLSCEDGLQCNGTTERCEEIPCTPGANGCACDGGACTDAESACIDGICQQPDCLAGQAGCPCLDGQACATTQEGDALFCEDGTCRTDDCNPGAVGCACQGGTRCDGGAQCVDGTCQPADCAPGSALCRCLGGACHPGLRCREDNLCVDATGFIGGPCTEQGTCNRGGRCGSSNVCVRCTLGTPGCACDDADSCFVGADCVAGVCVAQSALPAEEAYTPTCYSHCEANLPTDNGTVVCDSAGTMKACLDGRTCREGSCLHENEPVPTCQSEFDCPEWQTCIAGRCASQCDTNSHCPAGKSCYKHLCRVPCDQDNPCQLPFSCQSDDGESGFCIPMLPAGEDDPEVESFRLSKTSIDFNNTSVSATFTIVNPTDTIRTFTVAKHSDVIQLADGTSRRALRRADGLISVDRCDDPENDTTCDCALDADFRPTDDCWCTGADCFCSADSDCVDNGDRCVEGACRPAQCTGDNCPLTWLTLNKRGQDASAPDQLSVSVPPGSTATIELGAAAEVDAVSWQGTLTVAEPQLGRQQLNLSYTELPEGQWAGTMVYLSNFGTRGVEEWRVNQTTRSNLDLQEDVGNALIQLWGTFRRGRLELDELQAMFTATQTGSWQFANVQSACEAAACYMYDSNRSGLVTFSNDLESVPVPSGVVELPFAMNLHQPDPENDPRRLVGRIESSKALQYAGNPAIELVFNSTPEGCDLPGDVCVALIDSMEARSIVGGRYLTTPGDTGCGLRAGDAYVQSGQPWLVPGFLKDTTVDDETGLRYRYECRDSLLPYFSEDPDERQVLGPINTSLTLANPIPDGRARQRTLTLLDGAMINKNQMVLLFEERFDSFLGDDDDQGFSAYGFLNLQRRATDLDEADEDEDGVADVYQGSEPFDDRDEPQELLAPACSRDLLTPILGNNVAVTRDNVVTLLNTLIEGIPVGATPAAIGPGTDEQVHYFCEDTGLIDGGHENYTGEFSTFRIPNNNTCAQARNGTCNDGGSRSTTSTCALGTDLADCGARQDSDYDARTECPAGSNVIFFTVNRNNISQNAIASLACQTSEQGCFEQLQRWRGTANILQYNPTFRCADPNRVYCDDNRRNLREGKTFYSGGQQTVLLTPLRVLIDEAFRYKTRFQNRQGQGIGFAPSVCVDGSDAVPYCYDPSQIEEIQERIDCLLSIHRDFYDDLRGTPERLAARALIDDYLKLNFATEQEQRDDLPLPITHDGFERQLAQLLIMQGDESFTRAFASRFDLANTSIASFEGELFERDGVNLSGVVGFEMYSLYQAAQYYQMVLDRFYTMSPVIWESLGFGSQPRNFVTPEMVINYLGRVVRASTQKSRTWGEIARRYQNLGRPDLARTVAERAYTAAYLESIVMSRMMLDIVDVSLQEDRDQIVRAAEDSQRRYKVSMLDIQDIYNTIEDNITIFGFEPDFVPFPALDNADFRQSNAFEVLMLRARNKVQFAREKEDLALAQNREFETDQAQFQSELTQIRNNFENQLGDLCGTFIGPNDRVFPAIKKYAHLRPDTTVLGEPCGLVGNGQIHQALAAFDDLSLEAQALKIQIENVIEESRIERERVSGQCNEILEAANFLYGKCTLGADNIIEDIILNTLNPFGDPDETGCIQAQINDLQDDIRGSQFTINRLQTVQSVIGTVAGLANPSSAAAIPGFLTGMTVSEAGISFLEVNIHQKEKDIAELERFKLQWQTENECDLAKVDSQARVRTILLRLKELDLEALRLEHRARLATSELQRLRNLAKRLEDEQAETEQLTINVQAAHNNPNVRIYKNDAIINAEIAFDSAIQEVYKLTKVFEYYTSTSYARKDELYLIRMVARGDKNLENYINELEDTFFDFEEFFGSPAPRVLVVSLKNDILHIPYTDEHGRHLGDGERTQLMRQRLTDRNLLDRNGYLTMPFSTNLDVLSPLTRNHKILRIQADVYGNDMGDTLGRVYLRQKGTGVIRSVEDTRQFHRFDERTAVINTLFSNTPFFDQSIYQDFRLRDRPLVNTHWELVINQRDEAVNRDWNLNSLTDMRLYIYYTDFTVF